MALSAPARVGGKPKGMVRDRTRRINGRLRQRMDAQLGEIDDGQLQRGLDSGLNDGAQAAAIVVQLLGLDADQQQPLGAAAEQCVGSQHLLETGLVQAHLLGAEQARHRFAPDAFEGARLKAVVDGIEDDEQIGGADAVRQIQALGAAVEQGDVVREAPA